MLDDAVPAQGLEHLALSEAVVENARAGPEHHLRRHAPAEPPGETQARSEVGVIIDVVLRLKTQAKAE